MKELVTYDFVNQWEQYIMRGVHIKVFDYAGHVISDEFASPYMNSPTVADMFNKKAKVFWYRKLELIWPKCIQEYFLTDSQEHLESGEIVWIRCPPWDSSMDQELAFKNYEMHHGSDDDFFYKRFGVQKYQGFEVQLQTVW